MWRRHPTGLMLVANVFDKIRISEQVILRKLAIGKGIYTSVSVFAPSLKMKPKRRTSMTSSDSGSQENSYLRYSHSLRWLEWSCRQLKCWIWPNAWSTLLGHKKCREWEIAGVRWSNSCFEKRPNHLITSLQVDYVLLPKPSASMWEMSRFYLVRRSPSSSICSSVISVLTSRPHLKWNCSIA